jgi:hypothetical protein
MVKSFPLEKIQYMHTMPHLAAHSSTDREPGLRTDLPWAQLPVYVYAAPGGQEYEQGQGKGSFMDGFRKNRLRKRRECSSECRSLITLCQRELMIWHFLRKLCHTKMDCVQSLN